MECQLAGSQGIYPFWKARLLGSSWKLSKSPVTQEVYKRRLATFLGYAAMDVDSFVAKAKANPSWAEDVVLRYLLDQKERALKKEIQAITVGNVKKPVKLLLEMNDVSGINWKRSHV